MVVCQGSLGRLNTAAPGEGARPRPSFSRAAPQRPRAAWGQSRPLGCACRCCTELPSSPKMVQWVVAHRPFCSLVTGLGGLRARATWSWKGARPGPPSPPGLVSAGASAFRELGLCHTERCCPAYLLPSVISLTIFKFFSSGLSLDF